MKNTLPINNHNAVISFDPEINMFRGEFVDLNGGADFYSDTVEGLYNEGIKSLETFLEVCKEKGISPTKNKSGKVLLRLNPKIHQKAILTAKANGQSLNEWASRIIAGEVEKGNTYPKKNVHI